MKKILLVLVAVSLLMPIKAQEVSESKNVLKVNTLALAVATGSIFYERGFSDALSGQLGVAYLGFKATDTKFTGLILTPEVRFYPKKNAIDGFYVAPYVRYQNFTLKNEPAAAEGTLSSFGGGLLFGRQWITNGGFTMDLFFGGHYGGTSFDVKAGDEADLNISNFQGFKPRLGFAIGFAF